MLNVLATAAKATMLRRCCQRSTKITVASLSFAFDLSMLALIRLACQSEALLTCVATPFSMLHGCIAGSKESMFRRSLKGLARGCITVLLLAAENTTHAGTRFTLESESIVTLDTAACTVSNRVGTSVELAILRWFSK